MLSAIQCEQLANLFCPVDIAIQCFDLESLAREHWIGQVIGAPRRDNEIQSRCAIGGNNAAGIIILEKKQISEQMKSMTYAAIYTKLAHDIGGIGLDEIMLACYLSSKWLYFFREFFESVLIGSLIVHAMYSQYRNRRRCIYIIPEQRICRVDSDGVEHQVMAERRVVVWVN